MTLCAACKVNAPLPEDDLCHDCAEEYEEEAAYWERRKLEEYRLLADTREGEPR